MKRVTQEYQHYLYWKEERRKERLVFIAKKAKSTASYLLLLLIAIEVFLRPLTLNTFLRYAIICSAIGIWDGYRSWNINEKRYLRNLKWHE